jgi:hypothetical protein
VLLVLTVTTAISAAPLALSSFGQGVGSAAVGLLNDSTSASDGTTNAVVESVHYQAWLRRAFGSSQSDTAAKFGPELLASQRFSWTEYDEIQRRKGQDRVDYTQKLIDQKSKDFKDIAGKIKSGPDADPIAYKHLTGAEPGSSVTVLETLFAAAAGPVRTAVDLLVIVCFMMLTLLGLMWVVLTPYLLTPKGQEFGRGLFDNAWRSVVYVIEAALTAWLFVIYLGACLAPGMSGWWSLLLLTVGASCHQTATRDRLAGTITTCRLAGNMSCSVRPMKASPPTQAPVTKPSASSRTPNMNLRRACC